MSLLQQLSTFKPKGSSDLFVRLYQALSSDIDDRASFFEQADKFLSSSKLPAYIVAAFIKKLSRMSLGAPPEYLMLILPFICNLLMRHPTLMTLKDRVNQFIDSLESNSDGITLDYMKNEDPYNENENDFQKCNAMESCLWEIAPLRFHWHPAVAESARFLDNDKLPDIECDLTHVLELTSQDMNEYFE